jgi:outer membrane protein OmpA-like peptidoglycan-associated protein
MMDNQERDMRQALANSDAAAVRREGDLLAITLKGDVTFDHNSAIVRPGLYSEIDRIANVMLQYPDTLIRVEGHTDSTGTEQYNLDLSARRAVAVKNLIVQRGVSSTRVEPITFGESRPIATNETEAGRQMNRRVEIKIAPSNYSSAPRY